MALTFRNLVASPQDPVDTWPSEAVATALERGDLGDLSRLASAVATDPWGRTARQIEEALGHTRPYGVAELMEAAIRRARHRAEAAERAEVARELSELMSRSGLTRADFARRLGTSRSRLSTYLTGQGGSVGRSPGARSRRVSASDDAEHRADRDQLTPGRLGR